VPTEGLSIISDIDDTIKESNVVRPQRTPHGRRRRRPVAAAVAARPENDWRVAVLG
jgi:phosphatidate phosphatase APP1